MMKWFSRHLVFLGGASLLVVAVGGSTFFIHQAANAQKYDVPPPPVIPQARAEICGNTVVEAQALTEIIGTLNAKGCTSLRAEPLHNDYWLVFGTKVIVGEFP